MKNIKLSKLITIGSTFGILLTVLSISGLWIYYAHLDFRNDARIAEKLYIADKKDTLKQRVESIVRYINIKKEEEYDSFRLKIRNRAYLVYSTINNIYKRNSSMSEIELKNIMLNLIKSIEFYDSNGHFFIADRHLNLIYSNRENCCLKNVLLTTKLKGDRFYIQTKMKDYNVLGYILRFKPFDWYIGYAENDKYLLKKTQESVLKQLAMYRYGRLKHGYFFAAKLLNIEGGKCFGRVLLNPNNTKIVGRCLSDNKTDSRGYCYRKQFLKDLKEKGYSVVEYAYKIPDADKIGLKVSYIKLYKPWGWIIGSGYYIQDLKQTFVELAVDDFKNGLSNKVALIVVISTLILFILFLIYAFIYNIVKKQMGIVEDFFKHYPEQKSIDTSKIGIEDIRYIADKINNLTNSVEIYSSELQGMLKRYKNLVSYMPDCVFVYEKQDRSIVVKDINRCVEDYIGKKKSEIVGKDIDNISCIPMAMKDKIREVFEYSTVIESSDCINEINAENEKRYFSCTIYKTNDNEAVLIAKDITDSVILFKQREEELDKIKKFMDMINTGVIVVAKNNDILYINNIAKEILEIDGDTSKKELVDIIGYRNVKLFKDSLKLIQKGEGRCKDCTTRITTKTKKDKWLYVSIGNMNIMHNTVFVISIYDITEQYLKEKETEYISFHDDLTGLYNRRYFKEEIRRLFNKRNYPLSLIIYDLNGLKIVNDTLGHNYGDELIKSIADILQQQARANDIVSRIGGDEFAVIMSNTNRKGVEAFINRVNISIDEYNAKKELYLSASLGYSIQDGGFSDIDELFSSADKNMYGNKHSDKRKEILRRILKSVKYISKKDISDYDIDSYNFR